MQQFAARLENAWGEANAQQTAGRDASHVTVQGGSLRGRNLSLGPLTINSSGNARLAIAALTLVAVAGVALAAYGGQQLIVEVISPQAGATATITASVTPEEAQEPDPADDSSDTPEPEPCLP